MLLSTHSFTSIQSFFMTPQPLEKFWIFIGLAALVMCCDPRHPIADILGNCVVIAMSKEWKDPFAIQHAIISIQFSFPNFLL